MNYKFWFMFPKFSKVLKTDKDKEEMKHEEELREVLEKHAKELQDLGTAFALYVLRVVINAYFVTVQDMHGFKFIRCALYDVVPREFRRLIFEFCCMPTRWPSQL